MNGAPSKNLIEEVALLMSLSSSYVEKDWYIVQILKIVSQIQYEEFNLIFAGGTALSKAHKLIYRMSEDIDFKLNIDNELQSRKSLSAFKKFILIKLESSKLQISIKKIRAKNDNKFFSASACSQSLYNRNVDAFFAFELVYQSLIRSFNRWTSSRSRFSAFPNSCCCAFAGTECRPVVPRYSAWASAVSRRWAAP